MSRSAAIERPQPWWIAVWRQRPEVPSWLISMVLHAVLFAVLMVSLQSCQRQGAATERIADVGIVLRGEDGDGSSYEGEPGGGGEGGDQQAQAAEQARGGSIEELLSTAPPLNPADALPVALAVIGPNAQGGVGLPGAVGAIGGPGGGGSGSGFGGGKGRPKVFGVEGEGYKFVYVFDRSGSMGGSGRNALEAAKAELIASLDSLESTHQFQIIFYNDEVRIFNPAVTPGKLGFADARTKNHARRWIGSITAGGGTRHEEALMAAIRMAPDVIFFLTDADEPKMSAAQLDRIRRRAVGITINAIEFGMGPKAGDVNFLQQLASQNGGQYGYVDITKMLRGK